MKKVIILFTVLMTSMLAFAQQQKELARFHVTYAIYNGEDITEWAIKSKLFTVFYTVNEELYMANYSETNETQSWGVIWGLKMNQYQKLHLIIKQIYFTLIGIIKIRMILKKELVRYNL